MSEHWFKRYVRKRNEARASWRTHPAYAKAVDAWVFELARLAYGYETLLNEVRADE